MSVNFSSWILRGATRALAAVATLAILGLATPSASAAVSLSYTVNGGGPIALVSGTGTGNLVAGTITYNLTATATDLAVLDRLNTTTINVTNNGTATSSITLAVTGIGYTLAGTTTNGATLQAQATIQGTGGPAVAGTDTTTGTAFVDGTNAAFGTATPTLSSVGTTPSGLSTTYSFTGGGQGAVTNFIVTTGATGFSISDPLTITLAAGSSASFTEVTNVAPHLVSVIPEPSSLAIAGIGALGLIGFGLRRRKAQGA
jgi:hypothetical protein